jgi:hypothetical protein
MRCRDESGKYREVEMYREKYLYFCGRAAIAAERHGGM